LNPERAKAADLSLADSHLLGGVSLGWFANRTSDLIVPVLIDPATFTYGPRNIDHAFIQGLTLDARTPPLRGITVSLNLTDLYRAEDLDTGARLPNDPVLTSNLRLDYTAHANGAIDALGFSIHSAGNRGAVNLTAPLFDQPVAFTGVDAYVRVRAGRDLLLTLRGYNLGDERYAAVGGYPMPGRSFLFEVSTK
jgi:outer membrane receptor protein involved in Fe transport